MRVERELLHHPRYVKLKLVSGNPAALEWLIALWGYCQKQRSARFDDMSAECLADACGAIIDGEKLLTFLLDCRWVKMEGKTLVVRKWEHWNAGLIQRWEAGKKTASAHHAADKRPLDGRPPSARAVPRKMDGLIDRRSQSAVGTSSRKGKPTLTLIDDVKSPQEEQRARVLAAHYDLNGPIASNEERRATLAKFGSLTKSLADKLKTGEN